MDSLILFLSVLSLVGVLAYAFVIYQSLKVLNAWGRARWSDEWGRMPLMLRLPPRLLTFLLGLCFLALVL